MFNVVPSVATNGDLSFTLKTNAFGLCKANQLPIQVFNINEPGAIARILRGERVGTIVR